MKIDILILEFLNFIFSKSKILSLESEYNTVDKIQVNQMFLSTGNMVLTLRKLINAVSIQFARPSSHRH